MIAFLFALAVTVILILALSHSRKEKSGNWIQFFSKGKEAGFSLREMEQLRQLAINCNIQDPVMIFKSQKQIESCIRSLVRSIRMSGGDDDPWTQDFLSKLFDYCKKIEMEVSESHARINSSRQMDEGQPVRILVPGTGVYRSEVIKNAGNTLTVSRPVNNKITTALQWHGLKISIYFWRADDAGYVFDTDVVDEVFSKGISSLKVEHCDSLFRTQKRKSMRIKLKKTAFLYIAGSDERPGRLERAPGVNCMLEDISETGCAFSVKGQASSGLRLKVQFALDRIPICMLGTVRSVDFREETGLSLVHMEADPLPQRMRNHVLGEVFHMLPEDDDDELPFRVLEEEAKSMTGFNNDDPTRKFQEAVNE
ncbi:MAG: PilZ domain-containing protein [Treponema sp.]|jgi:c-di-GMP-binding flagellar brake protein YcgR|nr:PilZ domain-containing protein [Treponema sp.]